MTHTRRIATAALVGAAAVTAWLAWPRHAAPAELSLRFSPGSEYDYKLVWRDRSSTHVGANAGTIEGHVHLEGRLVVRAYREQEGRWLLGLQLAELSTHDVELFGRSVPSDVLVGARAFVEVTGNGAIASVQFERSAPELWKQLAPVMLSELDMRSGGRAEAAGPFGVARNAYVRSGAREITRTRDAYTSLTVLPMSAAELAQARVDLDARARVALASSGAWQRVTDRERLRVHDGSGERVDTEVQLDLELQAARVAQLPSPPALAQLERRTIGEVRPGAAANQYALEQKVDGLTRADVMQGLSSGGAIADIDRWVWRASGLLELDPALAEEVGALVASGKLAGSNAELALDLLASCGTAQAQAAMRTALSSAKTRGASNYTMLLQRFSLVARPTAETAAFIGELYQREHTGAAAYTLGAVVRNLAREGDPSVAQRWNAELVADLAAAREPARQTLLLGALGNAGRTENVSVAVAHATSNDEAVRAAAARALRHTDTPQARATLRTLFGDDSPTVQREVMAALGDLGVASADLASLREHVAASGVHRGNEGSLVNLVAGHVDTSSDTVALLQALAAAPSTPLEVRSRIATLLHRAGA